LTFIPSFRNHFQDAYQGANISFSLLEEIAISLLHWSPEDGAQWSPPHLPPPPRQLLDLPCMTKFQPPIPQGFPSFSWVNTRLLTAFHLCDWVPPLSTILLISFMYNDHIIVI
jgi:hypothetical protein